MEIQEMAGDHQYLNGYIIKEAIIHSNTNENKQEEHNSALPSVTEVIEEQNILKIVSVISIPNQLDLWQKLTEQEDNLQRPKQATDLQENTTQDTNLKLETEHHILYNNLQEYPEDEQITSDIMQPCIEVKTEINEQINPPYLNIIRVKEEAFDYENDMDTNKSDDILSSKNVYDVEITIKDEFAERILSQNNVTNNVTTNLGKARKGKLNGILKKKKAVDLIMKNVTPSDKHLMLKCTVCSKAFLGNDAYKEHMKKHTNQDKLLGNTGPYGGVVLKVGDPLSDKCTIVKVKRVKSKAKTKEEEYEEILAKYLETIKARSENPNNSDSSKNNNSAQSNNAQSVSNIVNVENTVIPSEPKVTEVKPIKKKRRKRRFLTMSVTYKKCDDSCTNDESCTKSKICKRDRKPKRDFNTRYSCTKCEYNCKYKKVLETHMLTHRVKSFRCHLCEYKCLQRSHLDQHIRIHAQTKQYSCNHCEYDCIKRSHLDKHIRTHTQVNPFTCNLCDYTCIERSNLDRHMKIHAGVKPFSCIYCDYVCVQRAHLNNHIMRVHTK